MAKIKARDLTIKVATKLVAGITDCSVSITAKMDDTRTKEDVGPHSEFMRSEWSAQFNAVAGRESATKEGYNELKTAMLAGTQVAVVMTVSSTAKLTGTALVTDLNISAPVDGRITYSGTLKGIGTLTKN